MKEFLKESDDQTRSQDFGSVGTLGQRLNQ